MKTQTGIHCEKTAAYGVEESSIRHRHCYKENTGIHCEKTVAYGIEESSIRHHNCYKLYTGIHLWGIGIIDKSPNNCYKHKLAYTVRKQ